MGILLKDEGLSYLLLVWLEKKHVMVDVVVVDENFGRRAGTGGGSGGGGESWDGRLLILHLIWSA